MQLNPVEEFFKLAAEHKKVHVHAYTRHTPHGGTTEVHEYDREIDALEQAAGPDVDALLDTMAPTRKEGEVDLDAAEEAAAAPTAEELEQERLDIVKIEQVKLTKLSKEKELEEWRKWKKGGEKPEDLSALMKSLEPLIRHRMNPYLGRVRLIPDEAIKAEFNLRAVEALRKYNPDKAGLATHVYRYLEKAKRFVTEHQNVGRIPENRVYKIKQFQRVREEMQEETGQMPSLKQLAVRLKWPVAEVDRMDSELRSDLMTQGFENDPSALRQDKSEEVLRLFKYELHGNERTVYEYLTGQGRARVVAPGEIARRMNIPGYQVSRIKDSISRKLQKYDI